jgi:hypothetical protein
VTSSLSPLPSFLGEGEEAALEREISFTQGYYIRQAIIQYYLRSENERVPLKGSIKAGRY